MATVATSLPPTEDCQTQDKNEEKLIESNAVDNNKEAENPEPARTNIVFYWFQTESQDERPEDIDVRIFIPENDSYIALNFDSVGEVYESLPFPVPLGSHVGHLQILNKLPNQQTCSEEVESVSCDSQEYCLTQYQLAPFEATKERTRIIVKRDTSMKPIELPIPRSSTISLSPSKSEVKWSRTGTESPFEPNSITSQATNDSTQDDYDSGFGNERRGRKDAGRSAKNDSLNKDPHEATLGSIDEILKKFEHISALSVNGVSGSDIEPSESYAKLPEITLNGHPIDKKKGRHEQNGYKQDYDENSDQITTPTGTARNRQVSLLEEKVKSLEKSKAEQSNDIIVLKTKLMESERHLKEQQDVNVQRAEREVRYQSLHDENHRLTEELRKLKSECENTLSQSAAHKLASVETSSLAVMKRLEYLESELKQTRKMNENVKDELTEKSRQYEQLVKENERLRLKLGTEEKPLDKSSDKIPDDAYSKTEDFMEDTIIQLENTVLSNNQSQDRKMDKAEPIKAEQDSFTSTNLRFLRERLSELRQKNEKLQLKYNQVQSSLNDGSISKNQTADFSQSKFGSRFASPSRNSLKGDYSGGVGSGVSRGEESEESERDRTLRELEELRDHLASVRAQVKSREDTHDLSEANRNDIIGKLKKPSELFASLEEKPDDLTIDNHLNFSYDPFNKDYSVGELYKGITSNIASKDPLELTNGSSHLSERLFVKTTDNKADSGDSDTTDVLLSAHSANAFRDDTSVAYNKDSEIRSKRRKDAKIRRTRSTRARNSSARRRGRGASSLSGSSSSETQEQGKRPSPSAKFTNGYNAENENNPKSGFLKSNNLLAAYEPHSGRRERINDDIVEYKSRTDPFSQNMSKDMDFYDKELSLAIDLPHMTTSSAYRDIEDGEGISQIWNLPSSSANYSKPHSSSSASTKHMPKSKAFSRPLEAGRPYIPRVPGDLSIGDRIKFSRTGGKISQGIVMYIGTLPSRSDYYLGVELCDAEGKHDGVFQDRRYFTCAKNKGVFVSFKKIVLCYTH
ncbi:uncharacterized protein LOC142342747 isoform X2 [Convolutriloba macropyga]|uniref:uncharacterized protein LOC142342747 isoform X2 n=1 Tax=Convolutriloba macropyga TaxID=536237 RepID=UPI003F522D42